jgi:hypothetical protein
VASPTIPDGVSAARLRNAQRLVPGRMTLTGDEARYMVACLRRRAGVVTTGPDRGVYRVSAAQARRVAVELDRYLLLVCHGQDEVEA